MKGPEAMKPVMPYTNATTAYGMLNAICRIAKEEPKRIKMSVCYARGDQIYERGAYEKRPACNTIGCIAGWTLVLTGRSEDNERSGSSTDGAREILGLSLSQEQELFYPPFMHKDVQTKRHADLTVVHIRAFQRKYKDQLLATRLPDGVSRWRAQQIEA